MDYISHTYLSASEMLLGCHLEELHELEQRLHLLTISSTESEKHQLHTATVDDLRLHMADFLY